MTIVGIIVVAVASFACLAIALVLLYVLSFVVAAGATAGHVSALGRIIRFQERKVCDVRDEESEDRSGSQEGLALASERTAP